MLPSPPKHNALVAEQLATSCGGSVTVHVVVAVHPFASVTVNAYVPAFLVKVPVPVYGAVPPLAETVMLPSPPKHNAFVDVQLATRGAGTVTVLLQLVVQLVTESLIDTVNLNEPLLPTFTAIDERPFGEANEAPDVLSAAGNDQV